VKVLGGAALAILLSRMAQKRNTRSGERLE
jgi:hypothetical protein